MLLNRPVKSIHWLIPAVFITGEVLLLYFTPRASFAGTFSIFTLLFICYYLVIKMDTFFSIRVCIGLSILLRLVALFSLPALSDDYFRFIWDGKMSLMHINPFQFTPQQFLKTHHGNEYLQHLFSQMNSQEYHTVYPPVMQYIFAMAAYLGSSSDWLAVFIMKFFIFLAELGTMRLLYLLALKGKFSERRILWYCLNPLIIIELTGNVHFEGILIFFLAGMFYLLSLKKTAAAIAFFVLAISSKLIPLIFAPLLVRYTGWKKALLLFFPALLFLSLLFLPFIDKSLFTGMGESLRLFFHLFEFNASIFYFIRWIAYFFVDYDVIEEVAPVLALLSFLLIMAISLWPSQKIQFANKCMWIFFVYLLFSTMVHPWYITPLILFSVFTSYRFPVLFSWLIVLSYYPYSMKTYNEDDGLWLIAIEYSALFLFMAYEVYQRRKNLLIGADANIIARKLQDV